MIAFPAVEDCAILGRFAEQKATEPTARIPKTFLFRGFVQANTTSQDMNLQKGKESKGLPPLLKCMSKAAAFFILSQSPLLLDV